MRGRLAKRVVTATPAVSMLEVVGVAEISAVGDYSSASAPPCQEGMRELSNGDMSLLPTKAEKRLVFISNLLLNLCGVVLWAGMLLINALYVGIISTTGWDLSQVSLLYTLQVFTCFLSCPLWGALASYYSIRKLLAGAVFAGAVLNILTGLVYLTDSFAFFVVLQLLKGICLSPCQLLNRALIPKYYRLADRGKYYGLLEVSAGVGGLIGVIVGTTSYIGGNGGWYGCGEGAVAACAGGIAKWSVPFFVLGGLMVPCGFAVLWFCVDPSKDMETRRRIGEDRLKVVFPGMLDEDTRLTLKLVREMFTNKTWVFTVLQGVTGAFPWPALAMLLYWFQLLGIDPFLAILVSAGPAVGASIGGFLGGLLGDRLYNRWSKKYGRVLISHISIIVGPFLMIVMLFAIPHESGMWWLFLLYGVIAGLFIAWSAPNNTSNLSDVFPEATFPLAFGVSQLVEGCVAAWSPFLVSLIAERLFGVGDLQNFEDKSKEERDSDASGLAKSIFFICCVGWGCCTIIFSPIYYYYPRESRTFENVPSAPPLPSKQTPSEEGEPIVQADDITPECRV